MEDQECGLRLQPKVTYENVDLTPFSVMNVRLAAQVLSKTVSKIFSKYGPVDAVGTAEFFSNILLATSPASSRELKPFKAPFFSNDDSRFSWLKNQFLKFFEDWLRSVK